MKTIAKMLPGAALLAFLGLLLIGCVTEARVGTGVYYGPHREPWFHDDPWMNGPHWYRQTEFNALYMDPPRYRRH
jgi:hypothetical protein